MNIHKNTHKRRKENETKQIKNSTVKKWKGGKGF